MIFDIICGIFLFAGLVTGFKDGLVKTLLKGIFFIVGGLVGMYLVLERNQSVWLILAIILGAYIGSFVGSLIANSLRLVVVKGPLRLLDNLLGSTFEATKYSLLLYFVGTVLTLTGPDIIKNDLTRSFSFSQAKNYTPDLIIFIEQKLKI